MWRWTRRRRPPPPLYIGLSETAVPPLQEPTDERYARVPWPQPPPSWWQKWLAFLRRVF